jgi:hypothetical protein
VLEIGTADDARPLTGRHRAARSAARTVLVRGAMGLAGVLVAVALGWVTAAAVGLTGSPIAAGAGTGGPVGLLDDPTFLRTVDITGTPAPRTPKAPATDAEVASRAERPGPSRAAADVPEPAPRPEAAPTPARTPPPPARPGDPCPAEGRPLVCAASHGGDRLRWRRA